MKETLEDKDRGIGGGKSGRWRKYDNMKRELFEVGIRGEME